jgi:hypothetical protein
MGVLLESAPAWSVRIRLCSHLNELTWIGRRQVLSRLPPEAKEGHERAIWTILQRFGPENVSNMVGETQAGTCSGGPG